MNDRDIGEARSVVARLWAALAEDDDQAVERQYVPLRLEEEIGHTALLPGHDPLVDLDTPNLKRDAGQVVRSRFLPGSAARLRESFARSRGECEAMTICACLPYEDGRDACVIVSGPPESGRASHAAHLRFLIIAPFQGEWLIWGQVPIIEQSRLWEGHGQVN